MLIPKVIFKKCRSSVVGDKPKLLVALMNGKAGRASARALPARAPATSNSSNTHGLFGLLNDLTIISPAGFKIYLSLARKNQYPHYLANSL